MSMERITQSSLIIIFHSSNHQGSEYKPSFLRIGTMFDIFICDRLEQSDDEMSYKYLKVVPEAQMGVTAKDVTRISGRRLLPSFSSFFCCDRHHFPLTILIQSQGRSTLYQPSFLTLLSQLTRISPISN
jgi:hypothetical protein